MLGFSLKQIDIKFFLSFLFSFESKPFCKVISHAIVSRQQKSTNNRSQVQTRLCTDLLFRQTWRRQLKSIIKPTNKFPTKKKVDYRQRNASPPTTKVNRQFTYFVGINTPIKFKKSMQSRRQTMALQDRSDWAKDRTGSVTSVLRTEMTEDRTD